MKSLNIFIKSFAFIVLISSVLFSGVLKAANRDYDGDGKTDIAIRSAYNKGASGVWHWLRSSDGLGDSANFTSGVVDNDAALPGDYDGDGKCDPAIRRQGNFIILGSQNGLYAVQWGLPGDMP